jgi:hypothetical protein
MNYLCPFCNTILNKKNHAPDVYRLYDLYCEKCESDIDGAVEFDIENHKIDGVGISIYNNSKLSLHFEISYYNNKLYYHINGMIYKHDLPKFNSLPDLITIVKTMIVFG